MPLETLGKSGFSLTVHLCVIMLDILLPLANVLLAALRFVQEDLRICLSLGYSIVLIHYIQCPTLQNSIYRIPRIYWIQIWLKFLLLELLLVLQLIQLLALNQLLMLVARSFLHRL